MYYLITRTTNLFFYLNLEVYDVSHSLVKFWCLYVHITSYSITVIVCKNNFWLVPSVNLARLR